MDRSVIIDYNSPKANPKLKKTPQITTLAAYIPACRSYPNLHIKADSVLSNVPTKKEREQNIIMSGARTVMVFMLLNLNHNKRQKEKERRKLWYSTPRDILSTKLVWEDPN